VRAPPGERVVSVPRDLWGFPQNRHNPAVRPDLGANSAEPPSYSKSAPESTFSGHFSAEPRPASGRGTPRRGGRWVFRSNFGGFGDRKVGLRAEGTFSRVDATPTPVTVYGDPEMNLHSPYKLEKGQKHRCKPLEQPSFWSLFVVLKISSGEIRKRRYENTIYGTGRVATYFMSPIRQFEVISWRYVTAGDGSRNLRPKYFGENGPSGRIFGRIGIKWTHSRVARTTPTGNSDAV